MLTEPLFRDNFWSNLYHNFVTYLTSMNFGYYLVGALAFLLILWAVVALIARPDYKNFVPNGVYKFQTNQIQDWLGLGGLIISLIAYAVNMFSGEVSLFASYDSMQYGSILQMQNGILPTILDVRFSPLQGWDLNFVFALSNNQWIIWTYVLLKQVFCLFLIYKFANFITVGKRLLMLALVNFSTGWMFINNYIYPEQNLLIFVMASFIFLRHYQQKNGKLALLGFLLMANAGLYTKETVVLIYAGLGIYLVLSAVFSGKITPSSFLHPLRTISQMPVEFLLFMSALLWLFFFSLLQKFGSDRYIQTHTFELIQVLSCYRLELALNLSALAIMIFRFYKYKGQNSHLLLEGALCGSLIIVGFIVFYTRMLPATDFPFPYYLYLSSILASIYVFCYINNKWVLTVMAMAMLLVSAEQNYETYQGQLGKYRREVSEFIAEQAGRQNITIYFVPSRTISDWIGWYDLGFASTIKHYYPNLKLKMKSAINFGKMYNDFSEKLFPFEFAGPVSGDYVIINKIECPNCVRLNNVAYENRAYVVFVKD